MEPRIQYAKTEDGVSIAYYTLGEGEPYVCMPAGLFSHFREEWQDPRARSWWERLAEKRMVVRYDGRGRGLSERHVADFSHEALLEDLRAVVNRLAAETFTLVGVSNSGPQAIVYAAEHPERVSHLVMWCSWARASDWLETPEGQALEALRAGDWTIYTETLAHMILGWSEGEEAARMASMYRESVTSETAQAMARTDRAMDVSPLLPGLCVPTLVLHRRHYSPPDIEAAKRLASQIPDADLIVLDGKAPLPWLGDTDAAFRAIDEFLGQGEEAPAGAGLPEGTAIILFADIANSTALTEQLGDAAFRTKATGLDGLLRKLIGDAEGTPVEGKVLGDGVMAVFSSARQAIDCALRCKGAGDEGGLPLHLGIHAGDVIREGNTVYGGAVNLAQRVADACPAGEVFVSDIVRGLARTSTEVGFEDRGEHELKGIPEPQRLYAVREQG